MRNVGCLVRRSGVFYFRKAIPQRLRYWLGCREYVQSLRTHDPKLAASRALDMAAQLEAILARVRLGVELLSQAELEVFSTHLAKTKTEALLKEALTSFSERPNEDAELEAFHARASRQEILEDLRASQLSAAYDPVRALLSNHSVTVEEASAVFRQLCLGWLLGLADYYRNAGLIIQGQPEHPALTFEPAPRDSESAEPQKNELLLLQAATKFLED